jgi:hypothetical protein
MKIWIIYFEDFGGIKFLAEKLAEFLEGKNDVNVANGRKLKPSIIIEESPEIIIYGISFKKNLINSKIKKWINNFYKLSLKSYLKIQQIFTFIINVHDIDIKTKWKDFLLTYYNKNIISEYTLEIILFNEEKTILEKEIENLERYSEYIDKLIIKKYGLGEDL